MVNPDNGVFQEMPSNCPSLVSKWYILLFAPVHEQGFSACQFPGLVSLASYMEGLPVFSLIWLQTKSVNYPVGFLTAPISCHWDTKKPPTNDSIQGGGGARICGYVGGCFIARTASIAVRGKGSAYHFPKVMIYPAFLRFSLYIAVSVHCILNHKISHLSIGFERFMHIYLLLMQY